MIESKKIVVLGSFQFPKGMASTTRIISYCKGMIAHGFKAEVYTFQWQSTDYPYPQEGYIEGIKYKYSHFWNIHKPFLYKNLIDRFFIYFNPIVDIIRSHRHEHIDYVFISFDCIPLLFLYVPVLRLFGLKLVYISDEFPPAIKKLKSKISKSDYVAYHIISHFIEKRVLMTNALKLFYNEIYSLPSHIMCSILDSDRFVNLSKNESDSEYLCYMGNMQLAKDNVDNIINAFSIIAKKYPKLTLRLYGTPSENDRRIIEQCIDNSGCKKQILFMGRADYEEVPTILYNAKILVTSQPDTKRAQGGFPTKMAEYMMSGVPMIVTDVGEISQYVQDGVNTFMVPPDSPELYAQKLMYVLDHPLICQEVASRALKYAQDNFSAEAIALLLIEFLKG